MTMPALKSDVAITPAETTNAATASGLIDTLGCDWLTLDVFMTTSDDTTNNPSVLKLTECDTSNGTFVTCGFTGDSDFTIPAAVTEGDWNAKFNVDLLGRKRYLKLEVSPLTTQTIAAVANLGRNDEAPNTSTEAGCNVLVEG